MHSFEEQQRHARLQAFLDFKVKHPRLEEIDDALMQAIHGHRTYTLLPIYRTSGVGKSTVLKHVAESCRTKETDPSTRCQWWRSRLPQKILVLLHG